MLQKNNKEEIIYDNERPFIGGGSDSRVPVIYTTSYVGTGTYGKNNYVNITFDFQPEIIIISDGYDKYKGQPVIFSPYNNGWTNRLFLDQNLAFRLMSMYSIFDFTTNTLSFKNSSYLYLNTNSNHVFNSDNNALYSLNNSGTTYHVLAIGYKEES